MNTSKTKIDRRIKPLLLALAAGFLMIFVASTYGPAGSAAANENNQTKAQAQAKAKAKARADKAKAKADKARAKAEKAKAKRAKLCLPEQAADKRGYKYKRIKGVCKVVCKGKEVHANKEGTDCTCRKGYERPTANPGERRCIKSCPAGKVRYKNRCMGVEQAANEQAAHDRERTRGQLPEDLRPTPYTPRELKEQIRIAEQVQKEPPTASAAASKSYYERKAYEISADYWYRNGNRPLCKKTRMGEIAGPILPAFRYDKLDKHSFGAAYPNGDPLCEIIFNTRYFKRVNGKNATLFCNVMVHEVGHLRGYEHTKKKGKRDIMYPSTSASANKIKRCAKI